MERAISNYRKLFATSLLVGSLSLAPFTQVTAAKTKHAALRERSVEQAVLDVMPRGWKLAEEIDNQIPRGHHYTDQYQGPTGKLLILSGPKDVSIKWCDKNGQCYHHAVAKESLEVWVMPPVYHDSWKNVFNRHAGERAQLIYPGKAVRLYAEPSHHLNSLIKFKTLAKSLQKKAVSVSWPNSPRDNPQIALSWPHWNNDLRGALQGT